MSQSKLDLASKATGPVECLGQKFSSEEARREHYLKLLAQKLKNPEFRKMEGFPIGTDEDILALSDPPYYTACPNPWLGDFIKGYGTPYEPKKPYHREPFAADVSEGKNHPIYNAHSYHTKVPHRAIMRYILHYTQPGDVVFDGFCGTGMTGVAAQLCGDRAEVQELGYRVQDDGTILNEEGKSVSKLGARRAILNELSPAATFIAYNYNTPWSDAAFGDKSAELLRLVEEELGWMYQGQGSDKKDDKIVYTVWSEIFLCPECSGEVNFLDEALDEESESVKRSFPCPHCKVILSKTRLIKMEESYYDATLKITARRRKRRPTIQGVMRGGKRVERETTEYDRQKLDKIASLPFPTSVPSSDLPYMHMTHERARMSQFGITNLHQFFFPRAAHALGYLWEKATQITDIKLRHNILFWLEQGIWGFSIQNRYMPRAYSLVNRYLSGIYYVPSQTAEPSPAYNLGGKASRLQTAFSKNYANYGLTLIGTGSSVQLNLDDNTLDYLFVDPPFGENIYYGDLNYFVESWHRVLTSTKSEAIVDKAKKKLLKEYQGLMSLCFKEFYRVLKPGRWITVEFSNSQASVSQDIHPEFMQQLGASWKKWEARPEMSALLDQNFLCYDGIGEVPSQIHGYLSTQFKELRNLAKDAVPLKAKAKSRWYVPDPKKNVDVETLRNKRLLEEFWSYLPEGYTPPSLTANKGQTLPGLTVPRPKVPKGKKLKELRTEAVRVGFKHCYQLKDYTTILVVADMIPDSVLNEDEQLQMIYDTALTRSGSVE